jgi:hypothetical protein
MPRVDGEYQSPYPDVIPDTTIESAVHNGILHDLVFDANAARPITAGGTGATSTIQARTNLGAEVAAAQQQVTNYDSHVFQTGSFWSASTATNPPVPGNAFTGHAVIYPNDTTYITIKATNITDGTNPGTTWAREKRAGTWGPWGIDNGGAFNTSLDGKVDITGDTMSGDLTILKNSAQVVLDSFTGGRSGPAGLVLNASGGLQPNVISGKKGGSSRWTIMPGDDAAAEASNFSIYRHNDAGVAVDRPFVINRSSGFITMNTQVYMNAAPGSAPGYGNATTGIGIVSTPTLGQLFLSCSTGPCQSINSNADAVVSVFSRLGTSVGGISVNATAALYQTWSDEREKEDLKSFDAGHIIDDTKVYDFKWKSTGERSYGIIAQQAQEVYPAAVGYDKDRDWWGVDYSKYVPVILQELQALRARVAELEGKLAVKPA